MTSRVAPGGTHRISGRRGGDDDVALPQLYVVLRADHPDHPSSRHSLADVDDVSLGRGERAVTRRQQGGRRLLALRIPDPGMSIARARLTRTATGWELVDLESTNGTFVGGARVTQARLRDGDVLELGHTFFVLRLAASVLRDAPSDARAGDPPPAAPGLATLVPSLARDFGALARIATSDVAVSVFGETGTGKELAARAVHALSGRTGAFVAVNCGALPTELAAAELFGYRRGAFSGAVEDRPGLVRAADRGTLFLDEIGDLPPATQTALLRVLQEAEVLPLGATQPVKVDVRLVAATHRDIGALVERREFRQDLLARLSGFALTLPPLRERREDLGLLVGALLVGDASGTEPALTVEAARALFRHAWPSNVRELEKALGAARALAGGGAIDLAHLPPAVRAAPVPSVPRSDPEALLEERLVALLTEHHGNVSAVARAMGKARLQIQRWVKRFQLDPARFRRP